MPTATLLCWAQPAGAPSGGARAAAPSPERSPGPKCGAPAAGSPQVAAAAAEGFDARMARCAAAPAALRAVPPADRALVLRLDSPVDSPAAPSEADAAGQADAWAELLALSRHWED